MRRYRWAFAETFGVRPWEMPRLTLEEFEDGAAYIEESAKRVRDASRG